MGQSHLNKAQGTGPGESRRPEAWRPGFSTGAAMHTVQLYKRLRCLPQSPSRHGAVGNEWGPDPVLMFQDMAHLTSCDLGKFWKFHPTLCTTSMGQLREDGACLRGSCEH